jgi:hypothetical protein
MHLSVLNINSMSHTKTFKITPTGFDHQMIIIRELFDLVKITG